MANSIFQRLKSTALKALPNETAAALRKTRGKVEHRARKAKASSKNHSFRRAVRASLESPIDTNKVFYESFDGNGALCNPRAIYEHLIADSRFAHLTHVWSAAAGSSEAIRKSLGNPKRLIVVEHKSERYFEELHSAKYVISNSTLPHEFMKKDGQVYLNTWHGTPLKKMGYDSPGGNISSRNVMRNFLAADYLLSSSDFMTRDMYEAAYQLRGLYPGKIIEGGTPRIDRQVLNASERSSLLSDLRSQGVDVTGDRPIILYAPTWKGQSVYSPVNNVDRLKAVAEELRERVDVADADILIKAHQLVFRQGQDDPELKAMLIPNDFETNKILGLTDLLITDYSSIFYDFLASDKPIVFYVPDAAGYEKNRGLYFDLSELPGPITKSYAELRDAVVGELGNDESSFTSLRHSWRERFASKEDGRATSRVVNTLFGVGEGAPTVRINATEKKKLLIYPGGMLNNGITRAVHNLLDSIDHDKYDVTLTTPAPRARDRVANLDRINSNCRILARVGGVRLTGYEQSVYDNYLKRGIIDESSTGTLAEIFKREWRRMFGHAEFDVAIDFDGYSAFNAGLLSHSNANARVIWGHNDLLLDSQREVKGKKVFEEQFRSIFSMYENFDFLASVTSDLTKIHQRDLKEYFPQDRFVTVSNFLDVESINEMAYGDDLDIRSESKLQSAGSGSQGGSDFGSSSLNSLLDSAIDRFGWEETLSALERKRLIRDYLSPGEGYTNFVTTGRLSTEKNQQMLIRAFALLHETNPFCRLVIVGDGPLRGELENVAHAVGVSHSVIFAGHQANPFPIVANSDCFVFSSLYEGQGLALLEALVLDVPVVTAEYNVVHSVLPAGSGLITEPTVEGLAAGMQRYLDGTVPHQRFDTVAYNARARSEFDQLISRTLTFGN